MERLNALVNHHLRRYPRLVCGVNKCQKGKKEKRKKKKRKKEKKKKTCQPPSAPLSSSGLRCAQVSKEKKECG